MLLAPSSASMVPVCVEDAWTRVPPEYVVSTATLPALLPSAFFLMASMPSATSVPLSLYASASPVMSQQVLSMRR